MPKSILLATFVASLMTGGGVAVEPQAGIERDSTQQKVELKNIEQVWSVARAPAKIGMGVGADHGGGTVYAISRGSKAFQRITSSGELKDEIPFQTENRKLRPARFQLDSPSALVLSMHWGGMLAVDANGKTLWSYPEGEGINDYWVRDLDGDGLDEVVLGFNGFSGLHVLNSQGKLMWKNTNFGNVGRVGVVDLEGDGKPEVILGSEKGGVAVFKGTGERLPDISRQPSFSYGMLRPVQLSETDKAEGILIAGGKWIAAIDRTGTVRWQVPKPPGPSVTVADPAPGRPWTAVWCGSLLVMDTTNGNVIASINDNRGPTDVCWLPAKRNPLVVLSTPSHVTAYRITKPE